LRQHPDVEVIVEGGRRPDGATTPSLLRTTVKSLVADVEHLLAECFGPVSLIAEYDEESQLLEVADVLEGQLTATVHGEVDDTIVPGLLNKLAEKAGRIIWNGWPTTLSVSWAVHHGGPYPATTSPLHTSVGATAIGRFLRPITYQNVPDPLLPAALRDDNPLHLPRRLDGRYIHPRLRDDGLAQAR
jgi:NADP-dependent aldehyde dehydrogenase